MSHGDQRGLVDYAPYYTDTWNRVNQCEDGPRRPSSTYSSAKPEQNPALLTTMATLFAGTLAWFHARNGTHASFETIMTTLRDSVKALEPQIPDERAEVDAAKESEACAVCLSGPRSCVFVACGHKCVCVSCCRKLLLKADKSCPMCRNTAARGAVYVYE